MPDAPGVPGVPEDAGALREADERLRALLADKDAKIAELEERIARLERLISRNSGNSSMPPSADDRRGRSRRRARRDGAGAASRVSSAGRRALTWRGTMSRTRRSMCSRTAAAGAGLTWAARLTSASGTPTRSPTCPRRGRRSPSTTGTRWNAPAAAGHAPRPGGTLRGHPLPGCSTYDQRRITHDTSQAATLRTEPESAVSC